MARMKAMNQDLKNSLGQLPVNTEAIVEASKIPAYDTVNKCGAPAYSLSDELRLLSMLNVLNVENQFYRTSSTMLKELQEIIERIALNDPYFVAQAICWSRNQGEGKRTINHIAAILLIPFMRGKEWAKFFFGPYDRKTKSGGCVFRPDDMSEMIECCKVLTGKPVTNAMRTGFAKAIESLDTYRIAKYSKPVIDVSNLCHPSPKRSNAEIEISEKEAAKSGLPAGKVKTLDALMKGITVVANTWEAANSEAGQEVAQAVREGKLSEEKAEQVLIEAKNKNWSELLGEGKLGILAAIRNCRNIIKGNDSNVIDQLCGLVSNGDVIRKGRVMPYQLDYAHEITKLEFGDNMYGRKVMQALYAGYAASIPNLKELMPGRTCVFVDCSGSMDAYCHNGNTQHTIQTSAKEKAGLIAATIAKATGADIVQFGTRAYFCKYDPNASVFELGRLIGKDNLGGTSIASAFDLIRYNKRVYDRIIILSDNEANMKGYWSENWVEKSYKYYIREVANPYVYAVDLAAYGTTAVAGDKVGFYFGFGPTMFEDISNKEFNPSAVIDKVRAYKIM